MYSLMNKDIVLQPDRYVFMIDTIWNKTADFDPSYREVLVDIYAPEVLDIEPVDDKDGLKVLERAMKHAAQTKTPDSAKTYCCADNEDYGNDVIRIMDIEALDCWYGFIYYKNDSKFELTEQVEPVLEGLEAIWPLEKNAEGAFTLRVPAGGDGIIVLRRTQGSASFGLSR